MNRKEFLTTGFFASLVAGCTCNSSDKTKIVEKTFSFDGRIVRIPCAELKQNLKAFVIGDTHFALRDERDDEYADFYKRMGSYCPKKEDFKKILARAKSENADILMLVGDIISFPTLANIEFIKSELDACGIPWIYTAGNHDWHFEGVKGSDLAQREEWIKKRLLPFYQGNNPLMYSKVVNGIRIVAIDNSAYHVLPEQVEFWKSEAAKGDPIALMMHIPFWHEGWGVTTCACPTWGAATDPYFEIERRERWDEKLNPATFEFRRAVFETPNLVGIFTGHIHTIQFARANGQNCFGTPSGKKGDFLAVEFCSK